MGPCCRYLQIPWHKWMSSWSWRPISEGNGFLPKRSLMRKMLRFLRDGWLLGQWSISCRGPSCRQPYVFCPAEKRQQTRVMRSLRPMTGLKALSPCPCSLQFWEFGPAITARGLRQQSARLARLLDPQPGMIFLMMARGHIFCVSG